MGNSFIEDLIESIKDDDRFSAVETVVIVNRLLPPPTKEELDMARIQVSREVNLD